VDIRFDRGSLVAKTKPRIFKGTVARVHLPGDALNYATGPEHRDLAELTNLVSQLAGLPVVTACEPDSEHPLGHPTNLIISGVEYHEIGRIISARVTPEGHADADIYIHDRAALQEIEDGTKELSLGYRCSLDSDRFQRNIILDHLSVVGRARCGAACSLRTDALDAKCPCQLAKAMPPATIPSMQVADLTVGMTITLDEKSEKILNTLSQISATPAEEISEHTDCTCNNRAIVHNTGVPNMDLEALTKNLDAALAEIATLKAEITNMQAAAAKTDEAAKLAENQAKADLKLASVMAEKLASEIEAVKADAQAKVDAANTARNDADAVAFLAAVDARVDLLDDASKVGIEDARTKTDREIKVAIVKKVDDMDIEDTHTADYVNGMYAGAMKRHIKASASVAEVRTTIVENTDAVAEKVAADPLKTEAQIREATEAKRKNRWR
jgi:hypothetical protein